jgi:hypothetical protein
MSKLIKYSGATNHYENKNTGSSKSLDFHFKLLWLIAPQYLATFSRLEIQQYISTSTTVTSLKGNPNLITAVIYFLYGSYPFDVPCFIQANTKRSCAEVKIQTGTGSGKFPKEIYFHLFSPFAKGVEVELTWCLHWSQDEHSG